MTKRIRSTKDASSSADRMLQKAVRLEKIARALCVLALVAAILTSILPLFSAFTISANLDAGIVDDAATAAIVPVLPLGYACMPLIVLGIMFAMIPLFKRKPLLSLFGICAMMVGSGFLVLFALACGDAFPYREIAVGGGIREVGLQFADLLWRYYIALVAPLLLVIALFPAMRSYRLRDMADMMTSADTPSTIALDENDLAE